MEKKSVAHFAVAQHHPLHAGQAFQAHWAAGVKLVGGNADFRAQAIFEPVSEPRRGVHHDAGRIDLAQKLHGAGVIAGENGVGVLRAVAVDVGDGFIHPLHQFDGDDGREVLGAPVGLGGITQQRCGARHGSEQGAAGRAAAHFHALAHERGADARQEISGHIAGDQQGLGCVARAVALGLGVFCHANGHVEIGAAVHIHMAVAIEMLDDRHPRFGADALNQPLAAARNDDVDELRHGDERPHGGTVGGRH